MEKIISRCYDCPKVKLRFKSKCICGVLPDGEKIVLSDSISKYCPLNRTRRGKVIIYTKDN